MWPVVHDRGTALRQAIFDLRMCEVAGHPAEWLKAPDALLPVAQYEDDPLFCPTHNFKLIGRSQHGDVRVQGMF